MESRVVSESRWPMVIAVVVILVLTLLLPDPMRLGPPFLIPAIEVALLIAHVLGDPEIGRAHV